MRNNERLEQGKKFLEVLKGAGKNLYSARKKPEIPQVLNATAARINLTIKQLLKVYRPGSVVAWRSFLVPTEILYATRVVPFTPESACAVIAQNQLTVAEAIRRAEENNYDSKLCSFLKSIIGSVYGELMPTPDLVIASSCFCSGIGVILQDVARYYGVPFFYLNLPIHSANSQDIEVEYVARQLKALARLLCQISGASLEKVEKEALPRAIELSNQARRLWGQIGELRQSTPSPMSGREALDYATVLAQTWGSEEIVEIYKLLHSEIRERVDQKVAAVPNEKVRLFWLHLRPYYPNDLMKVVEEARGSVVFEGVNSPSREEMDPSRPYQALARETINNIQYGTYTAKFEQSLVELTKKFKIDGVVCFAHENCEWLKAIYPGTSNFFQNERIPILTLSGDCLVKGRDELLHTRIQAFLENLKDRKKVSSTKPPKSRELYLASNSNEVCFIGLDVGATTTKAVIFGQGRILGWSVFPTGADNKNAAEKALKGALRVVSVEQEDCRRFVVTGVGRGNISSADEQVTEITCHTVGVQHFFPEVGTIIDIGGQDTKVIRVKEMTFRMNEACAAGTGKFLEHMARALGVGLEEIERLDTFAEKPLTISRMCATFAESEVVNLVARGSLVEEIIRGIHEAVADKVVILLRQLSSDIASPLAVSGGVAMNRGIVRALERRTGQKILVPDNPQIIGALGAAIIASRG